MAISTPCPSIRSPPRRNAAHIAVDDKAPPSPAAAVAASLVRRLYARSGDNGVDNRRRDHPPNCLLAADDLHSPPRKARRCSPFRTVRSPRLADGRTSAPSPSVFDLFAVDEPKPTPTPTPTTIAISPALNARLQHIISTIKEKDLHERRAILCIPATVRRASSGKPKPVTAGRTVKKVGRPKLPSTKKGKPFINNNVILTDGRLRSRVFGGDHKELNYTEEERVKHDKEYSRQLKFRFALADVSCPHVQLPTFDMVGDDPEYGEFWVGRWCNIVGHKLLLGQHRLINDPQRSLVIAHYEHGLSVS
jgi:hypothetical protein